MICSIQLKSAKRTDSLLICLMLVLVIPQSYASFHFVCNLRFHIIAGVTRIILS